MYMPADGNIADALTGNIMNSLHCEYNYLSGRDYKHIYRMIPCAKASRKSSSRDEASLSLSMVLERNDYVGR